jgi:hypothetical protein
LKPLKDFGLSPWFGLWPIKLERRGRASPYIRRQSRINRVFK